MKIEATSLHCLCGGDRFVEIFTYTRPPKDEIRFSSTSGRPYDRKVYRCSSCGHFLSVHDMDLSRLYAGDYVTSNYTNEQGLKQAFERIISLDESRSDNRGRVKRILEFAAEYYGDHKIRQEHLSVLDIGSGLCVFLYAMKQAGWEGTALDPDPRAVKHAGSVVGVKAIQGDFMRLEPSQRYDLITFNKVLEHVGDPVAMLSRSRQFVKEKGIVYVEVPDGELAWKDGPEREEFAIDHPHIFSLSSLSVLATRAGFSVRRIERLREPSTKYTLRAFLTQET